MKKIKFVYIPVFSLLLVFGITRSFAQVSGLEQNFVSSSNQVGPEDLPMNSSQSSSILSQAQQSQNPFFSAAQQNKNWAQSPVYESPSESTNTSILETKKERSPSSLEEEDVEEKEQESLEYNPSWPREFFSRTLQYSPMLEEETSSSSSVVDPCSFKSDPVVDAKNIGDISEPLMDLKNQHQFCGYRSQDDIGNIYSDVDFCRCVREKTVRADGSEDSLYQKVQNIEQHQEAVDVYRQGLVDKVMPEIFADLSEMTNAANDFLSTSELSQMLYEVHSDVEDDQARAILEGMRQGMHTCSGLGMSNMVQELFNPDSKDGLDGKCDEKSAQYLLNGFLNAFDCDDDQCDDYDSFAQSKLAEGTPAHEALANSLTHKFSINLIKNEKITDENFGYLSSNEKINRVVETADIMTESDSSGTPFVHPDYVKFEKRLPSEEQLSFMYEFMQNKDNEEFGAEGLSKERKEVLDSLMKTLSRNELYKNGPILSKPLSQMDLSDKVSRLGHFTEKLLSDKEKRLENVEVSKKYLDEDVGPIESMKRMLINNYLYLGDDVLEGCSKTKRKIGQLCSSISGNGMALFSHPDFRDQAKEMILDEDIQKKIGDISGKSVEGRSPVVDQLYCHANFSSLSADCQIQASRESGEFQSQNHCEYSNMWLLSEEHSSLNVGHDGGLRVFTQEQSSDDKNKPGTSSYRDFANIAENSRDIEDSYGDSSKGIQYNEEVFSQSRKTSQKNVRPPFDKPKEKARVDAQDPAQASGIENEELAKTNVRDDSERTSRKSFSEHFASSGSSAVGERAQTRPPSVPEKAAGNLKEDSTAQSLQIGQQQRTRELKAELQQAKGRQQSLQDELDRLLADSVDEKEESHEAKLEEKREEIGDLEADVKKLETDIKREKAAVGQDFYPQDRAESKPTRAQSSVGGAPASSSAGKAPAGSSAVAPNSSGAGRGPASQGSSDPGRVEEPVQGLDFGAGDSFGAGNFNLRADQSFSVLPQKTDLSQAVKKLSGEDYVFMDTGRPGLVEKIVFEFGPDGEVLLDESGEPIILSREVVELEKDSEEASENQKEEDERSPAEDEMKALGEQEETPSYRWSDVEKLLDSETP